jgi:hypothetical protein
MLASLRTNHFLWWELRRTTASAKGIKWSFILLRAIPLTFLAFVALIPAYFYIDDSRLTWLPLMATVLFLPRLILALITIFVGIESIRQDIIQGRWEPLILTGVPARKIVWSKWVTVTWKMLPDQILFALPSVGLAIGISQFFYISDYCGQGYPMWPSYRLQVINLLLKPYCYYSNYAYFAGQLNPSSIAILIGMMLIIITTLFETSLISSIAILVGLSRFAAKGLGIFYGSMIRIGLLFVILLLIPLMQDNLRYNFSCINFIIIRTNICEDYGQPVSISYNAIRTFNRIYDTGQLAVMSLFDQGTLLAANVMRPHDDRLLQIYFGPHDDYALPYLGPFKYEFSHIYTIKGDYDNRPFVLRNLTAAIISCFFYLLLIRFFLRRAIRFAIVNHGASGYLEL